MRKLLVALFVGLAFLPNLSKAVEGSPVPTAADREAKLQDLKTKQLENQAARADRIKNYVDRVIERLNRVVTKLDDVSSRAGTYLTELEGKGVDTTDARTKLKTLQGDVLAAKGAITALPTQIGTPVNSEKLTVAEAKKIREAVKVAVESVKKAAKSGQDLIKAIRAARVSINPAGTDQFKTNPARNATSTGTTTSNQ